MLSTGIRVLELEVGLKQQKMSTTATTVFNCGVLMNPLSTNYERDRIGNLVFTIPNSIE
jgi:hypothetical protein